MEDLKLIRIDAADGVLECGLSRWQPAPLQPTELERFNRLSADAFNSILDSIKLKARTQDRNGPVARSLRLLLERMKQSVELLTDVIGGCRGNNAEYDGATILRTLY